MMEFVASIPDPVHTYVRLTNVEAALIELPQFQRLRRIKQLGVASTVFPGALHTRFEHSLGTMEMADLMFSRVKSGFSEEDRQRVRLAGLLHDIGHAAFSHTVELGLRRMDHIDLSTNINHETYTGNIIEHFAKIPTVVNALKKSNITDDPVSFFKKIRHIAISERENLGTDDRFLSSIISGEIDADRMDYLLRDGLHTGISFIGFSVQHLLEHLSRNGDRLDLGTHGLNRAFEEMMSINIGEAFLIARYHYYTNIINHPRNIAANLMLVKALECALRHISAIYEKEKMQNLLSDFFTTYDDNDLLSFIKERGGATAQSLIRNLLDGNIISCVADLRGPALSPEIKFAIELINDFPSILNGIEDDLRRIIKREFHVSTSVIRGIPKYLEVKIGGTYRFLYDESKLAASLIMETLSGSGIYIYDRDANGTQFSTMWLAENWRDITRCINERIANVRKHHLFQLELLILFFNELMKVAHQKGQPVRYITLIYEMIKWIQEKRFESFNYVFDDSFRIHYAPELFADIMKLGAINLIEIAVKEKPRALSDYGIQPGDADYIETRNHVYYQFYMTEAGSMYCSKIEESYMDYVGFLREHVPTLYNIFYK